MSANNAPQPDAEPEVALSAVMPAELAADAEEAAEVSTAAVPDEAWDVFELDEDTIEPEPEYGDFWGEMDDEEMI